MKVLIGIPCLLVGGTEIQTLNLVSALVKAGHEVTVVCYFEYVQSMINSYQAAGSRVVCLSTDGSRPHGVARTVLFLYKVLRQVVRDVRPDVAHVQYMAPGAIPILLLRLMGIKHIIATAHTMADVYPSLRLVHFIQAHLVKAFTCITLRAEQSFFGSAKLYSPEVTLSAHNHFTIYNTLSPHIAIISQPRHFGQTVTIGVVSRLEPIKGMDLVVPAFQKVLSACTQTRLLIVGDGSLRAKMEAQTAELGLTDSVTFKGRVPSAELQPYYDQIDVLWVPSRSEGFGLTALEGMARGCVVVAADAGGLAELLEHGKAGILCQPDSAADLAQQTINLLSDAPLLQQLSCQAVERSRQFDAETFQSLIADLYQKIS